MGSGPFKEFGDPADPLVTGVAEEVRMGTALRRAGLTYGVASAVFVLGLVAALVMGTNATNATAAVRVLDDRFVDYEAGSHTDLDSFGPWQVNFAGYGEVTTGAGVLRLAPAAANDAGVTHAALVTTAADFDHRCQVSRFVYSTVSQLRTGSPANPWEVGWVVWDYVDNERFSYGIVKPNGLEIGQRHPDYPGGQRFLHTSAQPSAGVGDRVDFQVKRKVKRSGATLTVIRVNGEGVARLNDSLHPYTHGRVGLYSEDAVVDARRVVVKDCS
ncbi:MAG: calcium-binding protein [Actinobacteria bacterium]|nr:calcium-binding protein [Actinomycetota bacterium]